MDQKNTEDPLTSPSFHDIATNPFLVVRKIQLNNGEEATFRPLVKKDAIAFGIFLDNLSQETRKRFGPHPINSSEAKIICDNLNYLDRLPLVVINTREEIIGYVILSSKFRDDELMRYEQYGIPLATGRDGRIAPVIADRYQNRGVGRLMLLKTLDLARSLGLGKVILWMGTQATNDRAVHFYEKLGFKKVGEFEKYDMNNFDMYLEL